MNDYKQRLAHYNDTEWCVYRTKAKFDVTYRQCVPVSATVDYLDRDARFFNRLTLLSWYMPLLVLVAVALWLSVLPGLVAGAILGGLLVVTVNNVEEALEFEYIEIDGFELKTRRVYGEYDWERQQ